MLTVEQDHPLSLAPNGGWDPRIEVVQVGELVRSHLIYTQRFTVVYDTLLGPLSGQWLAQRVRDRAPDRPVLVVISHSDWDHCWGTSAFDAPVLGLDLCAQRIGGEVGRAELAAKCKEHPSYGAVQLVVPNLRLQGEATLEGGDLTLQLLHTPGHKPDHLAIYIPEIGTLLPGDAVETPFALLDGSNPKQDLQEMQNTLQRFLDLDVRWLLANHAPPQQGSALIRDNLEYYRRLCTLAGAAESLESLRQAFPYPGPAGQDFYISDHARIVAAAWKAYHD